MLISIPGRLHSASTYVSSARQVVLEHPARRSAPPTSPARDPVMSDDTDHGAGTGEMSRQPGPAPAARTTHRSCDKARCPPPSTKITSKCSGRLHHRGGDLLLCRCSPGGKDSRCQNPPTAGAPRPTLDRRRRSAFRGEQGENRTLTLGVEGCDRLPHPATASRPATASMPCCASRIPAVTGGVCVL